MQRPLVVLAAIALVQAVGLVVFGLYDALLTPLEGASGAVGGLAGRALQVIIFVAFGVGMAIVARGWQRVRRWARAPFIVAQVIGVAVGIPMAQTGGTVARIVGVALVIVGLAGIVLAVSGPVTRALGTQR